MSKYLNRYLTKEYIQMANEHMKRCSTSYVIRKLQIKTTVRYHHIPIRLAKIQNTRQHQVLVRMWSNRNSHSLLVGMQNGAATWEESVAVSCKSKHTYRTIQQSHSLVFTQRC